ncbi:hypothetical protein M7I_6140 [Glarea lozoyensis 74030]|uniref:Uncharacterized protein n=1 Tax=Glarea lozoyensis (strain ATCC 74030 / MF5533) TaxID=1104152 RepID=H0ETS1_GLAL7|nr:hypothetical protein M7I_6140 [Glarea lozoyensis 74030]
MTFAKVSPKSVSCDHGGSGENLNILDWLGVLSNTFALPGKDCLVDRETVTLDAQHPAVCWNSVSNGNRNDISWNQFLRLDPCNMTISNNLRFVCRIFL